VKTLGIWRRELVKNRVEGVNFYLNQSETAGNFDGEPVSHLVVDCDSLVGTNFLEFFPGGVGWDKGAVERLNDKIKILVLVALCFHALVN
jgi:hypothetical protein